MGLCHSTVPVTNILSLPQSKRIDVLDTWPEGTLYEVWDTDQPHAELYLRGREVQTGALFANKRTVLLGFPGAFTPNCTRQHLPQYVEKAQEFFDLGVDQIIGITANDIFCARYVTLSTMCCAYVKYFNS